MAGLSRWRGYPSPVTDYDAELPPGYRLVPARTTYLEMPCNKIPLQPEAPASCAVARWERPPLDEYRALFRAVGSEWGWTGRLLPSDSELRELLDSPDIEVHRLTCGSRPAGFAELDRHVPGEVEIVYFGLAPEFIGCGLGGFLLGWTVNLACHGREGDESGGLASSTRRVWLHTCEFDHPGAVAVYRKAGFRIFDERTEMQPYSEAFLAKLSH
jgi:GNAT superfamily N-acetyltransferase